MSIKLSDLSAAILLAATTTAMAPAQATTALINFETTPVLARGPSIFVAVPAAQTIVSEPATFSGGVVLGFATFFPAIAFATPPNVYGTADFGNKLAKQLTIDINPLFATTEVSFALFNGEVFNQTYIVNAFKGATLVASQTLPSISPNFVSGYGLVDVISAGGITSVTIAPTGAPAVWDFLIDSVAFNQSIGSIINPPPAPVDQPPTPHVHGHRHGHGEGEIELLDVNFGDDINDIRGSVIVITPVPEPATWASMLLGLSSIGLSSLLRRRTNR